MDISLPTVNGSFGETPELTFPDTDAPQGLHVVVLEEGTGPTVQAGREIEVDYHGQIWDGAVFDSSFNRGAPTSFPIGVGVVIQGWDQGIVGKNVGSRLLISIPPEKGYGRSGNPRAGIKGTDTLVFVVDIRGLK
ncbi:MAG: FKBP-type peptidyl-prolyl cis-trans isomerase [Actinomycetaceae bacterium]|nr:FKBP-type peptidyl-prolyl cis-trans isomerase [Actinomycetaceae bacterium]